MRGWLLKARKACAVCTELHFRSVICVRMLELINATILDVLSLVISRMIMIYSKAVDYKRILIIYAQAML